MNELYIISLVMNVLLGVGGWALRQYVEQIKQTQTELTARLVAISAELNTVKLDYLHKADFREFKSELWERFDRLEKTLKRE